MGSATRLSTMAGADLKTGFKELALVSSKKLMANMATIKPKNIEPVSPIKIFAGVLLYNKNPIKQPHIERVRYKYSVACIFQKQKAKVAQANSPIVPARQLIPSIKLNALINTTIKAIEIRRLSTYGSSNRPTKPCKLVIRKPAKAVAVIATSN